VKIAIKYISAIFLSLLLFIKGDLSIIGAWSGTVNRVFSNTSIGYQNNFPGKPLTIKIVTKSESNNRLSTSEGFPIHLYDNTYKLLLKSVVVKGVAKFDLSDLYINGSKLIVVSPITGNEMKFDSNIGFLEFMLDMDNVQISNSNATLKTIK